MAYFRNSTVNLLNLHYGVHSLAISGGGAFFTVFLLQARVSAPAVMLAMAAILLGRFVFRPFVLALAKAWGLKPVLICGTVFTALEFPLLAQVHGVGPQLYAMCAVATVGDTLYWTCYHAYFAALGDAEHRGHQIGAREALAAAVGVVGPLIGGWTLATLGPQVAFGATAAVLLTAAAPLLFTPNVPVARETPMRLKDAWTGVLMLAADAWAWSFYGMAWQIALFVTLGRSFTAFGGAVALAAFVGALCGMLVGRGIDRGLGRRAVVPAIGAVVLCVGLRALGYGSPLLAVIANASMALVGALYQPLVMTVVYNQAQRSGCPLRYHIATEAGWDLGGVASLLVAAAMFANGAPVWTTILLALAGTAGMSILLWRSYGAPLPAGEGEAHAAGG